MKGWLHFDSQKIHLELFIIPPTLTMDLFHRYLFSSNLKSSLLVISLLLFFLLVFVYSDRRYYSTADHRLSLGFVS